MAVQVTENLNAKIKFEYLKNVLLCSSKLHLVTFLCHVLNFDTQFFIIIIFLHPLILRIIMPLDVFQRLMLHSNSKLHLGAKIMHNRTADIAGRKKGFTGLSC